MEGVNPARRYKYFRPRQAMVGFGRVATSTNQATVTLYNNSTGSQCLAVRDWTINGSSGNLSRLSLQPGLIGTPFTTQSPIIPDSATLAGIITFIDTTTLFTGIYEPEMISGGVQWLHNFPFCVLPPNWSLVVQAFSTGQGILASFVWEAIEPDELDFAFQDL
jgi:hypothetical protein